MTSEQTDAKAADVAWVTEALGALPEGATPEILKELGKLFIKQESARIFREYEAREAGKAGGGPVFLTRDDLDDMPPVEPLIEGMLNKSSIVWLSGKYGTYKTFLALAWACSVATGTPWEGHEIHGAAPVVYVAAEGARGLRARLSAWEKHFNRGERTKDLIVTEKGVDPRSTADTDCLIRKVKETGAALVVFDTMHRCMPGLDENSNTDFGAMFGELERIKNETGATVLVLHHTGHSGDRARGASSIEQDADDAYVISLKTANPDDNGPHVPRVLIRRKSKEGEADEKFRLQLVKVPVDPFEPAGQSNAYVTLEDPAQAFLRSVPGKEDKVMDLVRTMDAAGLPVDKSHRASRGWLSANGVDLKVRVSLIDRAISHRKERAEMAEAASSTAIDEDTEAVAEDA